MFKSNWQWKLPLLALLGACSLNPAQHPAGLHKQALNTSVELGSIRTASLAEISGMVSSAYDADYFWLINDSGNQAEIHRVDRQGRWYNSVTLNKAENIDWEAIASYQLNGKYYLLIGDVGDNRKVRPHVSLYMLEEPRPDILQTQAVLALDYERRIDFHYETGPKDVEAMAVDPQTLQLILMSKRTFPAQIFQLDFLHADDSKQARFTSLLAGLIQPSFSDIVFGKNRERYAGQPTDMAISNDGKTAVVLSYTRCYVYRRRDDQNWSQAFRQKPRYFDLPDLRQAESVTIDSQGKTVYISSEHLPAPLWEVRL